MPTSTNPVHQLVRRGRNAVGGAWFLSKEWLSRLPNPALRVSHARGGSESVREAVRALRRDGVAALPGHIGEPLLGEIKAGFEAMVERIRSAPQAPERPVPPPRQMLKYREQGYDQKEGVTESWDPFKHVRGFATVSTDPVMAEIAERYWGKRVMLTQAIAARYEPRPPSNYGSFGWHHDSLGKRLSSMLILTDVTETDQCMSYLKGSHRLVHPRSRSNRTFEGDALQRFAKFEEVQCTGKAGTVFMFDANGIHRGNRREAATRDTLISCFEYGHYIWPFDVPTSVFDALDSDRQAFLRRNPRVRITGDCLDPT